MVGDRYRVEGLVGEGGWASSTASRTSACARPSRSKVLHAALSQSKKLVLRFEREAVAVGSIDHPNVAGATDFGQLPDGSFFLVCEFIDGRSLRAEIEAGPMPAPRALGIMRGAVSAVAAAHAKGIVHRDLKPENVMLVDRDGDPDFVKVIDFGIAKLDTAEESSPERSAQPLTRLGVVMGTPDYMSPEQALGQVVDARADLYSLGVIFYELLAGRCPFHGEAVTVLRQHIIDEPPPLSADILPRLDPRVPALIRRLLAKDAAQRFQTATELLIALDALATPLDKAAGPTGRPPWVYAALGSMALVVIVATYALLALLFRGGATPEPGPATAQASAASSISAEGIGVCGVARGACRDRVCRFPLSSPVPSASSAATEGVDAGAAGTRPGKKRRTLPGGIYIPPPRTWFR